MPKSKLSSLSLALASSALLAAGAPPALAQGVGITDLMRHRSQLGPAPRATAPKPAAQASQRAAEYIVALVDSEPITNSQVQQRIQRVLANGDPKASAMPRAELARLVLERLIMELAQLHVAKEEGITIDDVTLDQAETAVARQNELTLDQFRQRLAAEGITRQEFRDDLRTQLTLRRLREREVDKVKISELEVDQYLREHPSADAAVAQVHASHILLRTDQQRSTAQAVALLKDFKRRIDAGTATFEGLARDNSQDASAEHGGDLGWRPASDFVPEFQEALNRLKPGQVSEPVVSRFGVHLIKLDGRRENKLSSAERRDAVRAQLREKRSEEAYDTWAQEIRARAYVELREPPQS